MQRAAAASGVPDIVAEATKDADRPRRYNGEGVTVPGAGADAEATWGVCP